VGWTPAYGACGAKLIGYEVAQLGILGRQTHWQAEVGGLDRCLVTQDVLGKR
jgi:hypothetical protein